MTPTPRRLTWRTASNRISLLAARERRGRLVENENADLARQRLGDLGQLSVGEGQVLDTRGRIEGQALLLEKAPGVRDQFPPVDQAEAARLARQVEIVRHPHRGHEAEFLVNHGDACGACRGRGLELGLPPLDPDRAAVLLQNAGKYLDEGRLARAVLAQKCVHLTRAQVEVDAAQRMNIAEVLDHVIELDQRWRLRRFSGRPCRRADRIGAGPAHRDRLGAPRLLNGRAVC